MNRAAATMLPLVAGDHLTRAEFLRRWEEAPEIKRAELIGGQVYMPSPLSLSHAQMANLMGAWLATYASETPGCEAGQDATWYMLDDAPQPDAHLRILVSHGGQSFVKDDFGCGAPELAAEVALSSASYDLHQKRELYAQAGVKEYLAVLLKEKQVRWGRLVGARYQPMEHRPDGTLRSIVFPGLWLDPTALLALDSRRMLKVLRNGLKSREHAEFVKQLAKRKK